MDNIHVEEKAQLETNSAEMAKGLNGVLGLCEADDKGLTEMNTADELLIDYSVLVTFYTHDLQHYVIRAEEDHAANHRQ